MEYKMHNFSTKLKKPNAALTRKDIYFVKSIHTDLHTKYKL